MKPKIICFDVDQTLVPGNSWQRLTEGLGASWQKHLDIYHRMTSGQISLQESTTLIRDLLWATGKAHRSFINSIHESAEPYPEAYELFSFLKGRGCRIYLISGGLETFVQNVAKKLAANGWYANGIIRFNDHGFLNMIEYEKGEADLKVKRIRNVAERNQVDVSEIVFVGDGENDIGAFEVAKGISVYSQNEKLKKSAWQNAKDLKDVSEIMEELLAPLN